MDEDRAEGGELSLSELQLALMRVLWAQGEASTAAVVEALHEAGRPLAHTTVATLLSRLEKRGLLSVRRDGRSLFYSAAVSEPQVQRSMLGGLLSTLFEGKPSRLLSQLLDQAPVDAADMAEMRRLLSRKGGRDA